MNTSNAVEQNVKPKKTPSQTEPFELVASLQNRGWEEREDKASLWKGSEEFLGMPRPKSGGVYEGFGEPRALNSTSLSE